MAWLRGVLWLTAALCLLACKETTHSSNIRTGGIAMLTTVTASSETHSRVHTELLVGGDESNTYVILDRKDRLIADADGKQRTMDEVDQGIYETQFSVGAGGSVFKVMLERDGDQDAFGSTGKLPEPFEVTSDFGNDEISRADDMKITWDPSDAKNDMKVSFSDKGSDGCIFDHSADIPADSGSYVLKHGSLDSTGPDNDPQTCDVTGTLSRSTSGSSDAHLDDESNFTLKQVRSFTFTSAP
jgi:hypothetical protein